MDLYTLRAEASSLLASELGVRTGFRLHLKHDEARKSQIGGIQGAVLGLLGLLLGFTFAMAVARYDGAARDGRGPGEFYRDDLASRRASAGRSPGAGQAVVATLPRCAGWNTEPFFNDPAKLAEGLHRPQTSQNALWAHAEAAARESPTAIVASFINALNVMIDTEAKRVSAGRNHIPAGVWVLVVLVASFGCYTSAYGSGAEGARSNFTSFFLPLLLTFVIALVFDIDHALQGVIGVSQQPLLELRESLSK